MVSHQAQRDRLACAILVGRFFERRQKLHPKKILFAAVAVLPCMATVRLAHVLLDAVNAPGFSVPLPVLYAIAASPLAFSCSEYPEYPLGAADGLPPEPPSIAAKYNVSPDHEGVIEGGSLAPKEVNPVAVSTLPVVLPSA